MGPPPDASGDFALGRTPPPSPSRAAGHAAPPADGERTAPPPRRGRPLRILGAAAVALAAFLARGAIPPLRDPAGATPPPTATPGTGTVAVTTGAIAGPDPGSTNALKLWLIDTQRDAVAPVPHADQLAPGGAYPLGWAPNNGPLIVGDAAPCCPPGGKTTGLRAIAFAADGGGATSVTLTDAAVTFPRLGLVKTA